MSMYNWVYMYVGLHISFFIFDENWCKTNSVLTDECITTNVFRNSFYSMVISLHERLMHVVADNRMTNVSNECR